MHPKLLLALTTALLLALFAASCATKPAPQTAARPNVIIILADDMGFSDAGCYGSEIATPNLDSLAHNGVRFTQFYNTARCWPTRAAILTGHYAQSVRRDRIPGVRHGALSKRPEWAVLLPQMLKPHGYHSYHIGKWHVDGMPCANGFDRSYYLEDCGRFFNPQSHYLDDHKLPPVQPDSGYYSTVAIADHTVDFLKQHNAERRNEPFFAYICFNAPHFPLQALPEDIAKYQGRYDAGWDVIRTQRWERMKQLGIVNNDLPPLEREIGPPYDFPKDMAQFGPNETNRPVAWSELTPEQQRFQSAKMSIHAAMIDRMDREIGRIVEQLRAMNALDNTLILFLSDNGASAEMMVRDNGHDPKAPPGSSNTHLCLGPGWSGVANTPLRRHKTWVHEGGVATPLIANWPNGIKARGELRRTPGHVIDLVSTILELAGVNLGELAAQQPSTLPGNSLVNLFAKDGADGHDYLWWEHEGNRALRMGDWKLVASKNSPWELYNLATDRGEMRDLAEQQPEKARELLAVWQRQMDECIRLASGTNAVGNPVSAPPR